VELLAAGRTAEVYAYGDGRVLKLDRPEWTGIAPYEAELLDVLAAAGLPVARSYGTATVDGRTGVVLERVDGPSLLDRVLASSANEAEHLAEQFVELHLAINAVSVDALGALVPRLRNELETSITDVGLRAELSGLLTETDDGGHGVCHFDFHPLNVLVGPHGWVVIDWLTAAAGPGAADFARTLVLWGMSHDDAAITFMRAVRRTGLDRRGLDEATVDAWIRVVAGARIAEGFVGDEAAWLLSVARGSVRLPS
jgi:Ser/Thr protein kinase RdoA (MazF antagonist)